MLGKSLPQPSYDRLDATLTFDVDRREHWQLSGDTRLYASHKDAPVVTWRGKADGAGLQGFGWHDAFLHLGNRATLAVTGGCSRGRGCRFDVKTHHAAIATALQTIGLNYPVKGSADATSSVVWKNGGWRINADMVLHRLAWSGISIPDSTLAVSGLSFRTPEHFELSSVKLRPVDASGEISLERLRRNGSSWRLSTHARKLEDGWAQLANIMLVHFGLKPVLEGRGGLDTDIDVSHDQGNIHGIFSADAAPALFAYGQDFRKPAGVRAGIAGRFEMQGGNRLLFITRMYLGRSQAGDMRWEAASNRPAFLSAGHIQLDLTALDQTGVRLPTAWKEWHGAISGHFDRLLTTTGTGIPGRLSRADADLQLRKFGYGHDIWNGAIGIRQGHLVARDMLWRHDAQHARLDAHMNLASMEGRVNLRDTAFSWGREDTLPSWLAHASLQGTLHNIELDWLGNTWRRLHGSYRLKGNRITLAHTRARLAGGGFESPRLSLELVPGSIRFSGPIRMAIVQPAKLSGLQQALGMELDGPTYLNAKLKGELPWQERSAWKGNGDIEIQHGHWLPKNISLVRTAAGNSIPVKGPGRFSRLAFRFRLSQRAIDLSRIRLEAKAQIFSGKATVDRSGRVQGEMEMKEGGRSSSVKISGQCPAAAMLFSPAEP